MSWKGGRSNIYHGDEIQDIIEEIYPHLDEKYEGPTDFFRQKLKEEKEEAATIQDKINEFQKKKRIAEERIEELEKLKEEKKKKEKLRRLKNQLESKQEKYQELKDKDLMTVEEKRQELEDKLDTDQFGSLIEEKVEEHCQKLEERKDLDKLRQEIKNLQQEIRDLQELDSSPEWFLEVPA